MRSDYITFFYAQRMFYRIIQYNIIFYSTNCYVYKKIIVYKSLFFLNLETVIFYTLYSSVNIFIFSVYLFMIKNLK